MPISFTDLAPVTVTVELRDASRERALQVPVCPLSWREWEDVARRNPMPPIPKTRLAEDGETLLPNPNDARYLEQREKVSERILAERVFLALEKAGNTFEGSDYLEKWQRLMDCDNAMSQWLVRTVIELCTKGSADIQDRANSFPSDATA